MTPDRLFHYVDHQFNHLRDEAIRALNEGNATPNDRHTAAFQITEVVVNQAFETPRHFSAWCRVHGFRMIANEDFGYYTVQREYRAQRLATPQLLDPIYYWHEQPEHELAIEEVVEWTLTDVFHRPNNRRVYVGLGHADQGGYIVPDNIAAHILNSEEDTRPEYIEVVNGFDDVHSILNFSDFKKVGVPQ